jgi:hypothetical protein
MTRNEAVALAALLDRDPALLREVVELDAASNAAMAGMSLEELHAFAERLGLRRAWFQSARVPHYDLTTRRHASALKAGAVFIPAREQARKRIATREEP